MSQLHKEWKENVVTNKERIAALLDRLEAERDALAARLSTATEIIEGFISQYDEHNEEMGIWVPDARRYLAATPDTSAKILARRDAAIWMEAAEFVAEQYDLSGYETVLADALRAKADELLKGLEQEHE